MHILTHFQFSVSGDEVVKGLHFYFNKCIGTRLLYKKERKQYRITRLKYEHLDNSQIFGAEHLLRLFGTIFFNLITHTNFSFKKFTINLNNKFNSFIVELPHLIANSTFLNLETINVLKENLSEFLK